MRFNRRASIIHNIVPNHCVPNPHRHPPKLFEEEQRKCSSHFDATKYFVTVLSVLKLPLKSKNSSTSEKSRSTKVTHPEL